MVRKVTEISLTWQQKAFKAASRPCSAERGVGDMLKQGVGTRSSAPGSPSGCGGRIWEGNAAASTVLPRYLSPAPCSDAVPAAVLIPGGALLCGKGK